MGTTATALRTQPGLAICYVLAIEGYEYLITDHVTPPKVVTAWAGTGWTQAIPGLKVSALLGQRIEPWQTDLGVQRIKVAVEPLAGDVFGKAVWKTKPTFSTRLRNTFRPDPDGSGTIEVKSTAGAAGSGDVYIGGQRHSYSSTGADQFNVGAAGAGAFQPFGADGVNRFAGPSTHAENLNFDVSAPPTVSDVPPQWTNRKVALYVHRVVGGVLDTRSQALLEFAGRIVDFQDTETGETVLELEDMRACIRDALILRNQWTAYVKPGIRLQAGMRLVARERKDDDDLLSAEFEVVASGAAGPTQIDEGTYEVGEFLSRLDAWLASDATLTGDWSFAVKTVGEEGKRTVIEARYGSGDDNHQIALRSSSPDVLDFLGWDRGALGSDNSGQYYAWPEGDSVWFEVRGGLTYSYSVITGARAPYKVKFIQNRTFGTLSNVEVGIEAAEGTFYNQRDYLPPSLFPFTSSTGSWGVIRVGSGIYLGKLDGSTLSGLNQGINSLKYVDDSTDPLGEGLAIDSQEERLQVSQILLLEGSFADLFTKMVASVGGAAGVNHPDYDVFPWGAGIPWSLLGDAWLESVRSLEESLNSKSITTLVTEPTRLIDIMIPELILRFAWLVWKDEGYRMVTLPTPNSADAEYTLNEFTKAEPHETETSGRIVTTVTKDYLRNVVKLKYARNAKGEYRRTLEIIDSASVAANGGTRVFQIDAVNSFGQEALAGASVEEMAAALVSRTLPVFGRPLKTMRRSLAPTQFDAAPGDTCVVSDDHARDPITGARGLSSRAAVILETSFDRGLHGGKMHGEAVVLMVDEDRHYPMAPVAEIDTSFSGALDGRTFTNGYANTAAGGPAIKLKANAYSRAADPDDVTHWAAGYKGRLFRLDGGTSGDAWDVTVVSVDATDGYLVINTDLTSPAFTAGATEKYRLRFREWSACTDAQKIHAFQADDGDGMIEDAAEPNTYGEPKWAAFTAPTLSLPPNLQIPAETWGDGLPLDAGHLHDVALFNNQLPNYRTAINAPVMLRSQAPSSGVDTFRIMMIFPLFLGPSAAAGKVRKLYLAPMFRSSDAANTATVRVTSSQQPPAADPATGALRFGPEAQSLTFTTMSTALGEAAEQSLLPVRSEGVITWITVELAADTVAETCYCQGLSRCYVGPAEVP